ncbi:unnamed protein product [Kluyveromyces dobzhanskii CBS 2104]|uniref:WGS project CCBQ000000000 data, contig 00058 n=1 Tax=Kluyveromyces dobzhanskii CBS 2104 TaxID=1427455 RepID=A0A0A8LC64_9SACH|nr:unnamed protein product [Kluyveromyces dobzhanskii CBS 2104]
MRGFTEVDIKSGVDSWFLSYLEVTNPGFKKSKKNLNKLKSKKDTTLNDVVEYFLAESENELKRLQVMSPEEISRQFEQHKQKEVPDHTTKLDIENLDESIIRQVLYDEMKPKLYSLTNTEQLLDLLQKTFDDPSVGDKSQVISLEQMVQAFELSKLIPNKTHRLKGMYLSGQLIYGLKKVRLDPVNESFYIDSLLRFKKFKTAASLFESYKDRVNKRWWYEVGMMVYLKSNKFYKFNNLYLETKKKFGKAYVIPSVLFSGINKHLHVRQIGRANQLTNHLISMIDTYGWLEDDTASSANANNTTGARMRNGFLNFESSEEADTFLNEKQKVSKSHYLSMVSNYLSAGFKEEGYKLFAKFEKSTKLDKELFNAFIAKLRLQWLKGFDSFAKELTPYLSPEDASQKVEQLKGWYNDSMINHDFSKVRNSFSYLLYDDVKDLQKFKRVSDALEKCLFDFFSRNHEEDTLEYKSRKIQMIMKLLLIGDRERAALQVLAKLEETKRDKIQDGTSVYPPVNSHHYLIFIEHYRLKFTKNSVKKIEQMIERATQNNTKFDSLLSSSVLRHLMHQKKLKECIELVNTLLSTSERSSPLNGSTEAPQALYMGIWKTYEDYYKLMNRKSTGSENSLHGVINMRKDIKSGFDHNMLDVFYRMVVENGIRPNHGSIKTIINAFAANKEWNNLICVLSYMHDEQMLEIPGSCIEFVRKGLKKDYVEQLKKKIESRTRMNKEPKEDLSFKLKEIEENRLFRNLKSMNVDTEENYQSLLADIMEYLQLIKYSRNELNAKMEKLGLNPADLDLHICS